MTIIGIILLLPVIFFIIIILLFSAPWWGIWIQFAGIAEDLVEAVILQNQIKRLKTVGIVLPSYEVRLNRPVTDWNGSFYGTIWIKFKKPLPNEYIEDFNKHISETDPAQLWHDGHIITKVKLFLDENEHKLGLTYTRFTNKANVKFVNRSWTGLEENYDLPERQ